MDRVENETQKAGPKWMRKDFDNDDGGDAFLDDYGGNDFLSFIYNFLIGNVVQTTTFGCKLKPKRQRKQEKNLVNGTKRNTMQRGIQSFILHINAQKN